MKIPMVYTMTANKYLSWFFLGNILSANGGFPAKNRGKQDHGIERAVRELEKGHSVIVFPEGGLPVNGVPREPKKGVSVIQSATHVNILPVFISMQPRLIFPRFVVTAGDPIPPGTSLSPKEVMSAIQAINRIETP